MTLGEALEVLKAEAVVEAGDGEVPLAGCIVADLMSDVLAFARPDSLLLTGLATDQAIRTAVVLRLAGVVVAEGKGVAGDMIEAACEAEMPLYRTPLSKYESSGLLMRAGLRPYRKEAPASS